jgi:GTP cyclohydrolase IA
MHKLIKCNENIELTPEQKEVMIAEAAKHYGAFLSSLKFDWQNDPNASDTPRRVAKSFVNDLISGCYSTPPKITAFENEGVEAYDGMVFQGDIDVKAICAHHHLPFVGKAYVAYIPMPGSKVIGLSKLNRIVEFYSRRPQIQENLTMQIANAINAATPGNIGVAVLVKANHQCACLRGVKHDSTMMTSKLTGEFYNDPATREEFYNFVNYLNKK